MNIIYFCEALLAATVVSSITDCFSACSFTVAISRTPKYGEKGSRAKNEWKAILTAAIVSVFMAGAFFLLLYRLKLCGYLRPLELAFAVWMISALPATITNFIFIKLHPAVLFLHSLGWLVRLMVFAASYSLILDQ